MEEWDTSFESARNKDASHPLKDKVPLGQIGRRNINAPILVNPDISFNHADSPDISIRSHRPLKYKMATISALNPMQSPEKILVGAIKQHAVMMSSLTTDFLLFTHIYCL